MQKSSTIRIFSVILPTDKFQYTTIALTTIAVIISKDTCDKWEWAALKLVFLSIA